MISILRNLWAGFLHWEHAAHVQTSWSQYAASYCWVCGRSLTEDPVFGYALFRREDGQVLIGKRWDLPCTAFFLDLRQAKRLNPRDCEIRPAVMTLLGVLVLPSSLPAFEHYSKQKDLDGISQKVAYAATMSVSCVIGILILVATSAIIGLWSPQ